MTQKQIIIRSIICGCLCFVLGLVFNVILGDPITFGYIIENIFESVLFTVFMIWLLKTNKVSKKISGNGSFLKYFSIGMIGSWVVLTIMLLLQVGSRLGKVMVDNTALLIGIYLVVGIFCGLALYFVFRIAYRRK